VWGSTKALAIDKGTRLEAEERDDGNDSGVVEDSDLVRNTLSMGKQFLTS
jgi:hypothetical protein